MSALTIHQVQKLPLDGQPIARFHLDHPTADESFPGYALDVAGWIIGQGAAVRRIDVLFGEDVLRQADVWIPRPDVVQALAIPPERLWRALLRERWPKTYRLACRLAPEPPSPGPPVNDLEALTAGFHASVSLLGVPTEFELRVVAVLDDDRQVEVARLAGRRARVQPRYQPRRRPIVMTHLGRSGSTWLAHLLAAHPDILVHRRYPHEANAAFHTVRAMGALTTPTNAVKQADIVDLGLLRDSVRPMPLFCQEDDPRLHHWMRRQYVERHADFCLETIDAFYDEVAAAQDRPRARYYSEKTFVIPMAAELFHELYGGARELFLVRDFRDMVCSRQSFQGSRRPSQQGVIRIIQQMAERVRRLQRVWAERGAGAHLVRYEDLVLQPAETLQGIFDYLEIARDRATIDAVIAEASRQSMQTHVTSSDPLRSIGRWERDLPADLHALVNEKFRAGLLQFGYSVEGPVPSARAAT